jgi:hypothetical protein
LVVVAIGMFSLSTQTPLPSDVDLESLMIHFDSIFTKEDVAASYQKFLQSEFNEEPLIFLFEVQKLEELENPQKIIKKTLEIIEKHLLPSSEGEINISGKSKLPITQHYEKQKQDENNWMFEEAPKDLFTDICKIVRNEMYHDPWKRFMRTKAAEEIIQNFYWDSTVCSPHITQEFSYKDDYFGHPYIFKSDFKFMNHLFEDNVHWEVFDLFLIFLSSLEDIKRIN